MEKENKDIWYFDEICNLNNFVTVNEGSYILLGDLVSGYFMKLPEHEADIIRTLEAKYGEYDPLEPLENNMQTLIADLNVNDWRVR